jgi:long-chain-fatty-acid--[acyl-carrier-protein] ligase
LNGAEEVLYLKHYFFAPKLKRKLPEKIEGSVEDQRSNAVVSEEDIPEEIFKKVSEILVKVAGVNPSEISLSSNLALDLNVDSLLMVEAITAVEEEFKVVSQFEITLIKTVDDLCRIAMNQEIAEDELKPSFLHNHLSPIKEIKIDNTKNILENFIQVFSTYKNDHFAYDKILGSTTRKDFMLKAFVVSKIIRKEVKGKHVGIMLPALQSTALLVISSYLAGKIPVMLNWTVGKKVLDHCIETIDLDVILTAKTFHDKVADSLTENVKSKCVFFEQKVKEASLGTKLSGLFSNMFKITPKIDFNDVAVILFTSGSESLPKAVPLTHRNVIDNLWGVFEIVELNNDRVFLAFLPPFHSFGFTVLTILPLITGLKVAYTPDPTDNRELLKILKHVQANTVLATPTFLKMLLSISTKKDFGNVDLAITGAESLNPAIIKTFKEKGAEGARILEGYGITECSPVLTINPMDIQKEKSVGKFITGITYHITDINTYTHLKQGEEGMIMVKGNSIFNGYQDKKLDTPFVKINGEDFYKTGDLGKVDEDGYLFITGRLKRFIKIAGEMISLPAVENTLLKKYGSEEEVVMAIEGSDTIEPPQIALFSKIKIDINEANMFLKENGFSGIVKIHQVIVVDEIPLLGTGKTDYKILKEQIKN